MKQLSNLFLFFLMSVLCACGSDEKGYQLKNYLEQVELLSPTSTQAPEVDNFVQTIKLSFPAGSDLTQVNLRFQVAPGVKMIQPETNEATLNLEKVDEIVLEYAGTQIRYKIKTASFYPAINEVFTSWDRCSDFGELPPYLQIFKAPAGLLNKQLIAYIAVADLNKGALFNILGEAKGLATPAEFYTANNEPKVIINAGYFWDNTALSMICRNGKVIAPNLQVVTRSDGTADANFYPTRAAFGKMADGKYKATWTFTTVQGATYAYPQPSPNKVGSKPQEVPSATFPAGAVAWNGETVIGGGPVLLKDGNYYNTWEAELYDASSGIGPLINNPRSAVGITKYNHLVFFVCEGRNKTPNVPGLTLEEVANILKELGCVDAINLDGGGSSCMLILGRETIKPSDGKQRAVSSCITLN